MSRNLLFAGGAVLMAVCRLRVWLCSALIVALPAWQAGVWAQTAGQTVAEAERFHLLTQELRCVVCQNENLADSTAPLAQDLKREIREQMAAGQSDDEIKAFLVARYGDFITYKPPVRAGTVLLWAGPLLFLLVVAWLWWRGKAVVRGALTPVDKSFGENE